MIRLNQSGLATVTGKRDISPLDVLRMKHQEDRKDKEIKSQRQYATLNKIYDTSMQVMANDYGIYNDKVQEMYTKGAAKAVADIKAGKGAADTLVHYAPFTSTVGKINKLNQDEQKFALFVESNKLMSPEQKKSAKDDRMKTVFYNDDGTERSPEEAAEISRKMKIDMSQYIDNESVYGDFLSKSQQSIRQDQNGKGISSKMLYSWQTEDADGNIVVDLGEDGLVKEEVYAAFMADSDRAKQADYMARKEAGADANQGTIEMLKRKHVTGILVSHGDEGSKKSWAAMPSSYYSNRATRKVPYNYFAPFQAIDKLTTPADNDPSMQTFYNAGVEYRGVDITQNFTGLDNTKGLQVMAMPNGEFMVSRGKDFTGRFQKWIPYKDKNALVLGIGSKVSDAWEDYNLQNGVDVNPQAQPNAGATTTTVTQTTPTNPPANEVIVDETPTQDITKLYKAGDVTALGTVNMRRKVGDKYKVWVTDANGKQTELTYDSVDEAYAALGRPKAKEEEVKTKVGEGWND